MWPSFVIAVVVAAALLYVPGSLALRGTGLSAPLSVAAAPFVSVFLYAAVGIVLKAAGVVTSWVTLLAIALVLAGIAYALSRVRGGGEALALGPSRTSSRAGWLVLACYVAVGVLVGFCCFLSVMDGPESFPRQIDTAFHLARIRAYAESGTFSVLDVTNYPDGMGYGAALPGEFYPAAWHVVGAMVYQATGFAVPLVLNALDFAFATVVFPASMYVLLSYVFDDRPKVVALGSLVAVAFVAFPWRLLTFGLLCSNLASFAMAPAVAACFACLIDPVRGARHRLGLLAAFVVGCCGLAVTQPNAIFTIAVLLWPLCAWRVAGLADRLHVSDRARPLVRVVLVAAFLALAAAAWVALYHAPFMSGVLSIDWWPTYGKGEAAVELLLLAYRDPMRQVALAILVVVGGLYTLRERRYLWLSLSYASMLAIHFLVVATDGRWKHLLAGFWYRDPFRTAASCAILAIPLAVLGLYAICRAAVAVRAQLSAKKPSVAVPVIAVTVVCVLVYGVALPGEDASAFSLITAADASEYDMENNPYLDATELSFAARCKAIVGDDLVYNFPEDGSAFLYGAVGLHTYYRSLNADFDEGEPAASRTLRLHLNEIGTNANVAAAARDAGVGYVLLLDVGEADVQPHFLTYDATEWTGVNAVSDDTPGLENVLSEGDMRLYRVAA